VRILHNKYPDTDITPALQRGNTDTNEDSHNHRPAEPSPNVNIDARGSIFYSGIDQVISLGRIEPSTPQGRNVPPNTS
jgi:hypothetical protein